MRRGLVSLAVLAACRVPQYGYSLKQKLEESGLEVNEGTLYPLMRRLEEQQLLVSEWRIEEGQRPRRYYTLAAPGSAVLRQLQAEWQLLTEAVDSLLNSPISASSTDQTETDSGDPTPAQHGEKEKAT